MISVYDKIAHIESMVIQFEDRFEQIKKEIIAIDRDKVGTQTYKEDQKNIIEAGNLLALDMDKIKLNA